MKNFKIALLALLIVGSIGALFAFTSPEKEKKDSKKNAFVTYCFEYTGPRPASPTDVATVSNWTKRTSCPVNCPGDKEVICSITLDESHVNNPGTGSETPKVNQDQLLNSNDKLKTDLQAIANGSASEVFKTYYSIFLRETP